MQTMGYTDDFLKLVDSYGDEFVDAFKQNGDEAVEEYLGLLEGGSGTQLRNGYEFEKQELFEIA